MNKRTVILVAIEIGVMLLAMAAVPLVTGRREAAVIIGLSAIAVLYTVIGVAAARIGSRQGQRLAATRRNKKDAQGTENAPDS